ncbi:MAG: methyltransferase domain-containing protein [Thermoleophilaceae bacterium]|nr:methyltransferase domain-containing protein [Thermoleophilaceae bacterium]
MAELEFNERLSEQMEVVYSKRDLLRRRGLVHEALGAAPGERIIDAGCGPGFYVAELLDRVGPAGEVVGVDASPQMLALAAKRCEGHANGSFHEGDATSLPVESEAFDRALSVQVLEYVADVPAALAELHRVLRPGGRVLIWDVDWATVSWHSGDPDRMEHVLRAWDEHLSDPSLPRTLAARMRAAFEAVEVEGHSFATDDLTSETYAGALLPLIEDYVAARESIGAEQAAAWAAEQRELAERGESFFACIQFCFTATRPAG